MEEAVAIRPAVADDLRHALNERRDCAILSVEVNKATNAAHRKVLVMSWFDAVSVSAPTPTAIGARHIY